MIPQHLQHFLGDETTFIGLAGVGPDVSRPIKDLGLEAPVVNLDLDEPMPSASSESGTVVVVTRTATDLHRLAGLNEHLPKGKRLIIAVTDMAPHSRPVSVALPTTPIWQSLVELRIVRGPGSHWRVEAQLEHIAPIGALLLAVIASRRRNLGPRSPRIGSFGLGAARWTSGHHAVTATAAAPSDYPEADILVSTAPPEEIPDWGGHAQVLTRPEPPASTGRSSTSDPVHLDPYDVPLPPIDESTVNPIGFATLAQSGPADLRYDGIGWVVAQVGAAPFRLPPNGTVTDAEIAALRGLQSLRIDWNSHPGSTSALHTVAGLAAAGIPLTSRSPAPLWASSLGKELLEQIDRYESADLDDPFLRELHSLRTRRTALLEHSSQADRYRLGSRPEPSVSAVLCTRRPEYLTSITDQINGQRHGQVEMIAVLHGISKDQPEIAEALGRAETPLTVIEAPSSTVFGEALNMGFRAASGTYVSKFDDDDWYSPHHLTDLLLAHRYSGAELVGVHTELIHIDEYDQTVRKRFQDAEAFTRHLSGGTLLMRRDQFLSLGGYRPIRRSEDRGLLQDVLASGASVYKMHALGYVLSRRAEGHTWEAESSFFLQNNVQQWPGRNLGHLVTADELEECARN